MGKYQRCTLKRNGGKSLAKSTSASQLILKGKLFCHLNGLFKKKVPLSSWSLGKKPNCLARSLQAVRRTSIFPLWNPLSKLCIHSLGAAVQHFIKWGNILLKQWNQSQYPYSLIISNILLFRQVLEMLTLLSVTPAYFHLMLKCLLVWSVVSHGNGYFSGCCFPRSLGQPALRKCPCRWAVSVCLCWAYQGLRPPGTVVCVHFWVVGSCMMKAGLELSHLSRLLPQPQAVYFTLCFDSCKISQFVTGDGNPYSVHHTARTWNPDSTSNHVFSLFYLLRQNSQIINPKGNRSWIFTGRTDAEAEAPILWPPDVKSRLIGKEPDAGKDWRQKKAAAEDEMVRWHHWLNGHEFEQAPGDTKGQGSLVCCSPWDRKELDTT